MEKITYKGWQNCCRIANDTMELVVTADVGPRVIRCSLVGGENLFKEYDEMLGKTGGDEWRIYGGHRLWLAPEQKPRTYYPDNAPVTVEEHGGYVRFTPPLETTGIQKEIDVGIDAREARAEIVHRITNATVWAVELAPWALSVMAQNGKAIVPLPPRGSHDAFLLPTNTLTLWAYTDMTDPRWTWGAQHVMLRQDPDAAGPQKIGAMVSDGWAAYAKDNQLFVKTFAFDCCGRYPDMGCSVETFTNADMIELETLGPLATIAPGGSIEHVEHWHLFKDVPTPASDADVEAHVLPRVRSALSE
jgi:hypothetical protein